MRKRRRIEGVELVMRRLRRQGWRGNVDCGVRASAVAEDSSYARSGTDIVADIVADSVVDTDVGVDAAGETNPKDGQ